MAFRSRVKSADHHRLAYGVGFEGCRWALIASQIAELRVVSLRLKFSTSFMGVGRGSLLMLDLSVGRNSGHIMLRKLSFGVGSECCVSMSKVVMIG